MQDVIAAEAPQQASESHESIIAATATLESRVPMGSPAQQKPGALHDTSMGALEHRLEAEQGPDSGSKLLTNGAGEGQVADYNAWVHGQGSGVPGAPSAAPVASHVSALG